MTGSPGSVSAADQGFAPRSPSLLQSNLANPDLNVGEINATSVPNFPRLWCEPNHYSVYGQFFFTPPAQVGAPLLLALALLLDPPFLGIEGDLCITWHPTKDLPIRVCRHCGC